MEFVHVIIQGVLLGGLYALFAAGLSLIFGVMRLVNIAHGDLIVVAAYTAYFTMQALGVGPFTSLFVVVPAIAVFGYALQRGLLNFALGDELPPLLVTFGLSVIIQNVLLILFTHDSRRLYAGPIEMASWKFTPDLAVGVLPVIQFVVAVAVIGGLQLVFYRTTLGRAFRATSDDPDIAQLMGIENRHIFALAMALSLAVVAVAGVFIAIRTTFNPFYGPQLLIFGFEAVIMGGLGSLWGTLAGGVLLGLAQAIGGQINVGLPFTAGHIAFLLVLIVRPQGLFPQGVGMSAKDKDVGAPPKARVVHSTLSSRIGMTFWILLTAALVALPYWGDRQMMRLATEIYSFVALASLWNFVAGYAGLVSVGQQTFVGLGGYTLYLCALWAGLNPMVGLPLAGVIGALISVPIVLLLLKLRGAYFTIGSWVVAEVFLQIFQLVPAVGGGSGISLPAKVVQSIATSRSGRESLIYWIFLALAVAVIGVIVLFLRTRYGLALQAIRDNETAAKSNGIDVNRARTVVFVVAAAATAMVGSMVFLQKLSITPFSAFSINDWTVNMIFITVIGGIGRVEGPILGTVIFFVLREFLADLASTYLIILGVVAIGVMLKAPKGIWGYAADRLGWQLFPLARHLVRGTAGKEGRQALRIGAAGHSNAPPPTGPPRGLP